MSIPVSTMILIRNMFIFLFLLSPWFPRANKIPANPTMATEISAMFGRISDGVIGFHFLLSTVGRWHIQDKYPKS